MPEKTGFHLLISNFRLPIEEQVGKNNRESGPKIAAEDATEKGHKRCP